MDARVYHSISYGLYVLGVKGENGAMGGCVVNTLFQITATPPVFAVSVNKENQTCSLIQKEGLFTASALAQDCDPGIIGLFGFHSGRDVDKNQNGDLALSPNGLPYLKNGSCCLSGVRGLRPAGSEHPPAVLRQADQRRGAFPAPPR